MTIIINMNYIKITTVMVFTAVLAVSLGSQRVQFDQYHNYIEMTDYLKKITREFSNISSIQSIGRSVLGRDLWVVKLTTATELLGVPNIKIVGNIHGDEAVGREIILHLIQYLLDNSSENEEINKLLGTTVIHLLPSINPDGFEMSKNRTCPNHGQRGNIKELDLNTNFPDMFNPHSLPLQPETNAIMEWMKNVPFVMSLALNGGGLVAIYPYDGPRNTNFYNADAMDGENITPDDEVFRFLAHSYAKLHPTMHDKDIRCYSQTKFTDGITNGASLSPTSGTMQDYNYAMHGCLEITLKISCCKYPAPSSLESYWNENLKPLISWMQQAQRGIKGIVTDQLTGKPIPNATLTISHHDTTNSFNTTRNGEYWKILLPGVYRMCVNKFGYEEKYIRVEVPKRDQYMARDQPKPLVIDVAMDQSLKTTAAVESPVSSAKYHADCRVPNHDRVGVTNRGPAEVAETTVRSLQEQHPSTDREPNSDGSVDAADADQVTISPVAVPSVSAAVADNRFRSACDRVITILVSLTLFSYHVVARYFVLTAT